ncbi:ABC transporter ATP-binding protein [Lapidilactobacillus bayanensis]|uniref:ABC transporter ATP-binding protein n=1 Tax=Lapidilactobacillus bayanensis TaxID=2485998 RepID=UPI000F786233|nr:ABC transporter ATP-binding protein [Lapidilactobacillus bayanensis]
MALLELAHVQKSFGTKQVLTDLTFSVEAGSIFGFVGENGAGKTTTMKLILGLEKLDAGQITVAQQTVKYGQNKTNQNIGYLPDVPEYYGYLTATEYLMLCGHLTGMHKSELPTRIKEMLAAVDLPQNKQRIHGFSRGMKQRLGIAQALLNRPRLLICDEPTSALDPAGRREFLDLLASLRGETTIIFSTHILNDVERICDQVGILNRGRLAVNETLVNLRQQFARPQLQLTFADLTSAQQAAVTLQVTEKVVQPQFSLPYQGASQQFTGQVLRQLLAADIVPLAVNQQQTSLEDIFLEVVK